LTEAALPEEEANATSEDDRVEAETAIAFDQSTVPSSFYAMLRLCFRLTRGNEEAIPLVPAIIHRAMSGEGKTASELAARRLRGSGIAPLVKDLPVSGDIARRTAAAMLFPIAPQDYRHLERNILKQLNTINT
jgi:CRISPR-associated protein Csx17